MKPERITAIFFLTVITSFASLSLYSRIERKEYTRIMAARGVPVTIDWEKLYPFSDGKTHNEPVQQEESLFDFVKQSLEEYTSKYLEGYHEIVEAARMYEELVGWNMAAINSYNSIVEADDGELIGVIMSRDVSQNARAMNKFKKFCDANSVELVYFNIPMSVCKIEDPEIAGTFDYTNSNADRFLAMLKNYGIKCYDFREILHADGLNHHDSFFFTDHHWKPETGLWAAKHVLGFLRDDYGWQVDPEILNPENFNYVVYHDWFLGSRGKKLTLSRVKPDDISLIYPKFRTLLNYEIPQLGINTSGDFGITYNMKYIEVKDYYKNNPYAAYKYADQPLSRLTNLLNNNGKRILYIHASLSNCVIPFVALGVQFMDEIDVRHFKGSVENFVLTEKPDLVIVAYNSEVPGATERLFDFR